EDLHRVRQLIPPALPVGSRLNEPGSTLLVPNLKPGVDSLGPEIRTLQLERRPGRANQRTRSQDRRELGQVHGAIDQISWPGDVADVNKAVADERPDVIGELVADVEP